MAATRKKKQTRKTLKSWTTRSRRDFRNWAREKLLELASMAEEAAESGTATQTYFKGLAEARNAIKDALSVHADIQSDEELEEMRKLKADLEAQRAELNATPEYLPPPESEEVH